MMKKRGRGRGGAGTEEAALAARRAGLLDAYTESNTQAISDSEKFKEGYKKKSSKGKGRKSESEDGPTVPPPEAQPSVADDDPAESWDKEDEIVDSWEDIEAPEMPVPVKVKKEQLKQEKIKRKDEPAVANITEKLESVKLEPKTAPPAVADENASKPSPDVVKAEREAKKAAKATAKASAGKNKKGSEPGTEPAPAEGNKELLTEEQERKKAEKARRKAEFEAKKAAEAAAAKGEAASDTAAAVEEGASGEKSKAELKAERRAKQEAQRLAKSQAQEQKKGSDNQNTDSSGGQKKDETLSSEQKKKSEKKSPASTTKQQNDAVSKCQKVAPLFSHLHQYERDTAIVNKLLGSSGGNVHSSCVHLGLQLVDGQVVTSESKCLELLRCLQDVVISCLNDMPNLNEVQDLFKEIDNALTPNLLFLKQCRPLSISMDNSVRAIKARLKSLDGLKSSGLEAVIEEIRSVFSSFIEENLSLAAQQISMTAGTKIQNGDVILTYSENELIEQILVDASKEKKFKVIVVDGRVQLRGSKMAARLIQEGIETTYILVTAVSQILNSVTKVFLGCEGVMANGGVLAEVGTSQVALLAESVGVPVLMCCQSFKFTERVQTDSFVYNELLDPQEMAATPNTTVNFLEKWKDQSSVHLLNLAYDVTPASLVSAVITEISVVPTTSVPVILRLKNCDVY